MKKLLPVVLATALMACATPPPPKPAEPLPSVWRGETYASCNIRIKRALAFEAEGLNEAATFATNAERQRFTQYITDTELLSFGKMCGKGGRQSAGALGFLSAASASVPDNIREQGNLAVDLYRDMILNGHSAADIQRFIDDGTFESHMQYRRVLQS